LKQGIGQRDSDTVLSIVNRSDFDRSAFKEWPNITDSPANNTVGSWKLTGESGRETR